MRRLLGGAATITLLLTIGGLATVAARQQNRSATDIQIDGDDIGGVVRGPRGPEAGVWVIAETKSLPTGFRKIVVTDDAGRYVVPDLPAGTYTVWVRGYGLVDSKPIETKPGSILNLNATPAPSPIAAAQYYPANYWYSMIQVPPASAFPMEREGIRTQLDWVARMKSSIQLIQIGDKATREIPEQLGRFKTSTEAWEAWLASGESPVNVNRLNRQLAVQMYADWTDRIKAGEAPPAPPRPKGVERNVVITQWDVSDAKAFIHDVMLTDTRNPTLNANGLVYGPEQFSSDDVVALDPVKHSWVRFPAPPSEPDIPRNFAIPAGKKGPVPLTWGEEDVRPARMRLHNMMMDEHGRFWMTSRIRKVESQPAFCKPGSSHPSAQFYPLNTTANAISLQVQLYDPQTKKFDNIDTCFSTHHLQFANDADSTLWFSSGADDRALGYIKTKQWYANRDGVSAQGWCPIVLDTNGNGKIDRGWTEPNEPVAQGRDKRIGFSGYGLGTSPVDGAVWNGTDRYPGAIIRTVLGSNPPETCVSEVYNAPAPHLSNPKGVFVDTNGVVWVGFAASGHFASFDRRKCKITNGPTATGDHCKEGWAIYDVPGPKMKGAPEIGADWYYLNWVDRHDFLGLGKDIPVVPGTNSDSIIALQPGKKEFVEIRVPYPLGFFARGMDGRIDDPNAGWKGRAMWTNYASISPWNVEGGKGTSPKFVKFQMRPDPLAH